jgi:hypothetical protein
MKNCAVARSRHSSTTDDKAATQSSDVVRGIGYQPITIAADHDNVGRLIMVGERLLGVLVRLDSLHQQYHGKWFLEAGFGKLADAAGTIFNTPECAREQIGRLIDTD